MKAMPGAAESATLPEIDALLRLGAVKCSLPEWIEPQRAVPAEIPPPGTQWVHEVKFDGYRLLAIVKNQRIKLYSRSRNDWTSKLPEIAAAIASLQLRSAILDGEMIALDSEGFGNFQLLQNALRSPHDRHLAMYLFDLPYFGGLDLRETPLLHRKQLLQRLLPEPQPVLRFSDHHSGEGADVFREACRLGAEGVISKLADSRYRAGRDAGWVKVKCVAREEFVVVGFTPQRNDRHSVGALLLATRQSGGAPLVFAGKVGTGLTARRRRELASQLAGIAVKKPPIAPPAELSSEATWVKPALVAEVRFSERTADGRLRHPSLLGFRDDKPAAQVVADEKIKRFRE